MLLNVITSFSSTSDFHKKSKLVKTDSSSFSSLRAFNAFLLFFSLKHFLMQKRVILHNLCLFYLNACKCSHCHGQNTFVPLLLRHILQKMNVLDFRLHIYYDFIILGVKSCICDLQFVIF